MASLRMSSAGVRRAESALGARAHKSAERKKTQSERQCAKKRDGVHRRRASERTGDGEPAWRMTASVRATADWVSTKPG